MTIKEVILKSELAILKSFLNEGDLVYENDIDYSILVYEDSTLVGTASLAKNVMKCFLVKDQYQGKNITNLMFSHLANILRTKNIYHYFVFTTPENIKIFTSLNMNLIVKTDISALLEGGDTITSILNKLHTEYNVSNKEKSAVIINANPMTNGHLYLIEQASKNSEELLVFVVSEDQSSFPFEDRFSIIKNATKHLKNITILPTLNYLVSHITFPKYFLKEDDLITKEQTLIDVLVYQKYYCKIFNITTRYVGSEPFSTNTSKYNCVMKEYFKSNLKIIDRLEINDVPISASYVRKLIKNNDIKSIEPLVPKATFDYLKSQKGINVINKIQSSSLGRH